MINDFKWSLGRSKDDPHVLKIIQAIWYLYFWRIKGQSESMVYFKTQTKQINKRRGEISQIQMFNQLIKNKSYYLNVL